MLTFELPKFAYFCRTEGYVAQRSTKVAQRSTHLFWKKWRRSRVTTFQGRWWSLIYVKRLFLQNRAFSKKNVDQRSTYVAQRSPPDVIFQNFSWYYKFQETQLRRSKVTTYPSSSRRGQLEYQNWGEDPNLTFTDPTCWYDQDKLWTDQALLDC